MAITSDKLSYLGLGKTTFNSSVCLIELDDERMFKDITIWSNERISRKKADGSWPAISLHAFEEYRKKNNLENLKISENRDVLTPKEREKKLNKMIPFFDYIKKEGLESFSSFYNPEISFFPHHFCHAQVGKMMSPFRRAVILVIDGAGSEKKDISSEHLEGLEVQDNSHEESTLYLLEDGQLSLIKKNWQKFYQSIKYPTHWYSEGIGTCYEKVAEYIFNSKRAAGKVMGLAAFGTASSYQNSQELLDTLVWEKSFKGGGKEGWEKSEYNQHYCDLAASVQLLFEKKIRERCHELCDFFPDIENLIIVGGCALNCVSNMKILKEGLFKNVYIPPYPGDEGIALGSALASYYEQNPWQVYEYEKQNGYLGPKLLGNLKEDLFSLFKSYNITFYDDIEEEVAGLIADGNIIAWFQGRSESGPRALGNRSILARVDRVGVKKYLNNYIKFREEFRPYGCSVLQEKISEYFEVDNDFYNPYMSFAIAVKDRYEETFKEVTHIDGTSRMQGVGVGQNERFYRLIQNVGDKTGIYGVLNTSLNIMGEPILENLEDAKNFMDNSEIEYMAIDNYLIIKDKV